MKFRLFCPLPLSKLLKVLNVACGKSGKSGKIYFRSKIIKNKFGVPLASAYLCKEMTEYAVTGITYTLGAGLPREEARAVAEKFIDETEVGTPVILVAEPDNPMDDSAIAVYMDYTRHIGYIKSTSCMDVLPLLDDCGQCDAVVTGSIGLHTLLVGIPNAPETPVGEGRRKRVLPENPLAEVLRIPFSAEERASQVIAPRLARMVPTEENAATILTMAQRYTALSASSICFEDGHWRDLILKVLKAATALYVEPSLGVALVHQRTLVNTMQRNMTRSADHPQFLELEQQLKRLREEASGEDGLYVNFEYHIATSGSSVQDEVGRLEEWFRKMPNLKLRDWRRHQKLAEALCYKRVSREELYEVYASLLILEKYLRTGEIVDIEVHDILDYVIRLKQLLAADWTEADYGRLWARVLKLPAVKAVVRDTGKQKGTTFNRNLVASILHTMVEQKVFSPKANNQAMAEALEGSRDHSVRQALSIGLTDKMMKSSIEKIIVKMKE